MMGASVILTADLVCYARQTDSILLIQRQRDPFAGAWALPGGKMEGQETIEECALREAREEAGLQLRPEQLRLVGVFSDPWRDPRGRFVSVAFLVEVPHPIPVTAGTDAQAAHWWPRDQLQHVALAFDHTAIVQRAFSLLWG
jgi:8-oxo-dGTP diphosphatase